MAFSPLMFIVDAAATYWLIPGGQYSNNMDKTLEETSQIRVVKKNGSVN
jgi:hypothetical protein